MRDFNGQKIRTVGQWIHHLDYRVSDLERRIQPLEVAKRACSGKIRKKFEGHSEKARKALVNLGIPDTQIEILKRYGLFAVDNVTGFQEGRSGPARFETLKDAIAHVLETGERAFYVTMDIRNLSGLNARLGHAGANEVFGKVARIIQTLFDAVAKDVNLFRHGGDEMSAILFDADDALLSATVQSIRRAVTELALLDGLDDVDHPKHPGDPAYSGLGLHVGVAEIKGEFASCPQKLFHIADSQLERNKCAP